ncbi:MAG: hypothetical protein PHV02_18130 [Rhodocyclaceae bacterium]|nr:hypothetical protein [Rhodocyclaceae bacterium]
MPTVRNPLQVLKEAKQIARDHGCFVVEKADPKGTRYLVYRRTYDHNECVGARFSVTSLHKLVCKVTNFH